MQGGEAQPVSGAGVGALGEQPADGISVIVQRGVVQRVRPALSMPATSGRRVAGTSGDPAAGEGRAGADQGEEMRCVVGAPAVLCWLTRLLS
jgi:hypothetical protein